MTTLDSILTVTGEKWFSAKKIPLTTVLNLGEENFSDLKYCCGAAEVHVGYGNNTTRLLSAILLASRKHGLIISTVNDTQVDSIPLFEELGFTDSGWVKNPKSGRRIRAFTLAFPRGIVNYTKLRAATTAKTRGLRDGW